MPEIKLTPKALLDRMRKLTAVLLGYDLTNLTPAESIRLDRAATLRLELDDVQSRQLAGLPIDMAKFVVASEALERLVGGNPETSTTGVDFSNAHAELAALLDKRTAAIERRNAHELRDVRANEEMAAIAAASIDGLKPADGYARHDGVVPRPALIEPAAAVSGPPDELARLASKEVVNRPAAERARAERAWRDSYGGGGAICAPAWSPPGDTDRRR
jgi:hypothetical protein